MNYPSLICASLALATSIEMHAATPIVLDKLPLLFVDDSGVAESKGVERGIHKATTLGEPVVKADRTWENGRVYIYGAAVYDPATKQFAMWYGTPKPSKVLYATSSDGLNWTKPALNLFASEKSAAENMVLPDAHSPSVLFDEAEPDPARRYKMMAHGSANKAVLAEENKVVAKGEAAQKQLKLEAHRGYVTAFSGDGIHWTLYPGGPVLPEGDDTLALSRDPQTGEYLCYHKRQDMIRGFKRRVILLSRSKDFVTWSKPELVFAPDEEDDAWAKAGQRTDVYNMAVYPHAAGFIALPTIFRVSETREKAKMATGQAPDDGHIDIQFLTSADGTKWTHTTPRVDVLPRGALGSFDKGAILGIATQPVNYGDKTWVYYTAVSTTHGGALPEKQISIGRAEWRRDGFISLNAGNEGGTVETKPLQLAKPELVVNANASKGPIRVALLDADGKPIAGYGFEDCTPLTQDGTHQVVAWKNQKGAPTDRPIRVAIEMAAGAKLYSLSVE